MASLSPPGRSSSPAVTGNNYCFLGPPLLGLLPYLAAQVGIPSVGDPILQIPPHLRRWQLDGTEHIYSNCLSEDILDILRT